MNVINLLTSGCMLMGASVDDPSQTSHLFMTNQLEWFCLFSSQLQLRYWNAMERNETPASSRRFAMAGDFIVEFIIRNIQNENQQRM